MGYLAWILTASFNIDYGVSEHTCNAGGPLSSYGDVISLVPSGNIYWSYIINHNNDGDIPTYCHPQSYDRKLIPFDIYERT